MINCERGDVILIPFPFTDLSTYKQRPAVIISSNEFNQTHPDVIVVAVTSHIPDLLATVTTQIQRIIEEPNPVA